MIEGESQWFHGFDEDYFYDRGLFTRKLMGRWWASLYAIYYIVFKYQSIERILLCGGHCGIFLPEYGNHYIIVV